MAVHEEICREIDRFGDEAVALGQQIHALPEPRFEEHFAAERLSAALSKIGVEVERGVAGLGFLILLTQNLLANVLVKTQIAHPDYADSVRQVVFAAIRLLGCKAITAPACMF